MAQLALFYIDNSRKLCENAQGEALLLNQFWINATHPTLVLVGNCYQNITLCSRIFQKVKIRENKGQKLIFEFDHSDCLAF